MNNREIGIVLFALEFFKANLDDDEVAETFLESDKAIDDRLPTAEELGSLMTAMESRKSHVAVFLEGGRVRNVFTNVPAATIVVADYDHDGVPDEDLVTVWQGKRNSTKQASFCLQANEPLTGHVRDLVSWFIDRTSEDADD